MHSIVVHCFHILVTSYVNWGFHLVSTEMNDRPTDRRTNSPTNEQCPLETKCEMMIIQYVTEWLQTGCNGHISTLYTKCSVQFVKCYIFLWWCLIDYTDKYFHFFFRKSGNYGPCKGLHFCHYCSFSSMSLMQLQTLTYVRLVVRRLFLLE